MYRAVRGSGSWLFRGGEGVAGRGGLWGLAIQGRVGYQVARGFLGVPSVTGDTWRFMVLVLITILGHLRGL